MDKAAESVKQVVQTIEAVLPATPTKMYVPWLITSSARFLRDNVTSAMGSYRMMFVDFHSLSFWQAVVVIFLHPMIWNCLGRFEFRTRLITRLCFNKPMGGVCLLAAWIFLVGIYRDIIFTIAIDHQQTARPLEAANFQVAGAACIVFGAILVLSSFYQLGFAGTYLGDYFGILMSERITAFPFNILDDPMYDGSTMIFFGKALLSKSMAGIILSMWVFFVYRIASLFEGPFTEYIYSSKNKVEKDKTS